MRHAARVFGRRQVKFETLLNRLEKMGGDAKEASRYDVEQPIDKLYPATGTAQDYMFSLQFGYTFHNPDGNKKYAITFEAGSKLDGGFSPINELVNTGKFNAIFMAGSWVFCSMPRNDGDCVSAVRARHQRIRSGSIVKQPSSLRAGLVRLAAKSSAMVSTSILIIDGSAFFYKWSLRKWWAL